MEDNVVVATSAEKAGRINIQNEESYDLLYDFSQNRLMVNKYVDRYEIQNYSNNTSTARKKFQGEIVESSYLYLAQIRPDVLKKYRELNVPIFVAKNRNKIYFTKVPKNIRPVQTDFLGPNLCVSNGTNGICGRIFSASYKEDICPKLKEWGQDKRIEDYHFITAGYQVSCTLNDIMVVTRCGYFDNLKGDDRPLERPFKPVFQPTKYSAPVSSDWIDEYISTLRKRGYLADVS